MLIALLAIVAVLLVGAYAFTRWETWRLEARFPPEGSFIAIPGGRIHYTERHPAGPARATILLLHGASGNQADLMLPLGDKLAAKGFRVIAVDRPGYGWSDRPDGRADAMPSRQSALIRAGLEKIGVTHAIVVGHSLAGATATSFALDQRDFTQGLFLMSAVTHPWEGGLVWYNAPAANPVLGPIFAHLIVMPLGLAILDQAIKPVFDPKPVPFRYAERTGIALILRPASFMANAQDLDGLLDAVTQQVPRLGSITVPTALLTGDSDQVVSPKIHSETSAREIPGATLQVLPGVGHSPHWAEPDTVVAAIERLAERVLKPPAP